MGHLQTNEEAKVMNQIILQDFKTRLDEAKGRWMEELSSVLWAYHTMSWTLTNEMSFNLVFGNKVMILVKIGLPTLQTEHYDELSNPT